MDTQISQNSTKGNDKPKLCRLVSENLVDELRLAAHEEEALPQYQKLTISGEETSGVPLEDLQVITIFVKALAFSTKRISFLLL